MVPAGAQASGPLAGALSLALHSIDLGKVGAPLRLGAFDCPLRAQRCGALLRPPGERRPGVGNSDRVRREILLGPSHLLPVGEVNAAWDEQERPSCPRVVFADEELFALERDDRAAHGRFCSGARLLLAKRRRPASRLRYALAQAGERVVARLVALHEAA